MSAKNKAAKAGMNHEQNQHAAMKLIVEDLIEDLIEAGNGVSLDTAWASRRLRDLIQVSSKPLEFLARERDE